MKSNLKACTEVLSVPFIDSPSNLAFSLLVDSCLYSMKLIASLARIVVVPKFCRKLKMMGCAVVTAPLMKYSRMRESRTGNS
jgi:hypothetical protein